jgi:hypothetical protein
MPATGDGGTIEAGATGGDTATAACRGAGSAGAPDGATWWIGGAGRFAGAREAGCVAGAGNGIAAGAGAGNGAAASAGAGNDVASGRGGAGNCIVSGAVCSTGSRPVSGSAAGARSNTSWKPGSVGTASGEERFSRSSNSTTAAWAKSDG